MTWVWAGGHLLVDAGDAGPSEHGNKARAAATGNPSAAISPSPKYSTQTFALVFFSSSRPSLHFPFFSPSFLLLVLSSRSVHLVDRVNLLHLAASFLSLFILSQSKDSDSISLVRYSVRRSTAHFLFFLGKIYQSRFENWLCLCLIITLQRSPEA